LYTLVELPDLKHWVLRRQTVETVSVTILHFRCINMYVFAVLQLNFTFRYIEKLNF